MEAYQEKYQKWLANPIFDQKTKEELESIKGNHAENKDSFYKELEI